MWIAATNPNINWVGGTDVVIFLMADKPCSTNGVCACVLHKLCWGWCLELRHGRRRKRYGCRCERVGWGLDIGTSIPECARPSSHSPMTTTKCSGSPKCNCTEFQGTRKAKRCEGCRHGRDSHYDLHSDDDADDSSDEGASDGAGDSDNSDNNAIPPSAGSTKNKMTVSSLVEDLIGSGGYPKVDVDIASREAKAGLTRQRVGSAFAGSHP